MKKISVVVPCYNAAEYLDKCIQYLLNQTIGLENIEIILVNDASTDNGKTWEIIRKYEQIFPDNILAISLEENLRQGGARNVGISYASGEYLIFCDADDWLLEEALEHLYNIAKKYDADVVEFRINNIRNHEIDKIALQKGNEDLFIEIDTEEKRKALLLTVTNELSLGSQKKLYKLSLIQDNEIRFAEHLIFEEPSFMVPIRLYEKKHYFLDEALYVCYLSPESTVRGEWGNHKYDNPKVWLYLLKDLINRGAMDCYGKEIEYLFTRWYLGLTLKLWCQKGYIISKSEMEELQNTVLEFFPNILHNPYLEADSSGNQLILGTLRMEITNESIKVLNELLCKAFRKLKENENEKG